MQLSEASATNVAKCNDYRIASVLNTISGGGSLP